MMNLVSLIDQMISDWSSEDEEKAQEHGTSLGQIIVETVRSVTPTASTNKRYFLVTVKVAGTPGHDPLHKRSGACPLNDEMCDDVTGKHHTLLMSAPFNLTLPEVRAFFEERYSVTRVEQVSLPLSREVD